ncbi:MAG: hypothetical protein JAY96_15005, partial [Candidatus Thiodiazotropha endolucinida]|nr:hypothetical protein [Candidatus Thiodiazotropha taylori]MCW4249500.1 reverse transcriptase domain-containing protein [Candidatus Thiodiazotropha endolucinida]
EISDHSATYLVTVNNYSLSSSFKRTVWLYKDADFQKLNDLITAFDWSCLLQGSVNDACLLFKHTFLKLVNDCIPSKEVTIRPSDKPWYDSEIRKYSRKRDRLKSKALKSGNQAHWSKYKTFRNKVNNLKKHAKETFFNNLEISLTESFTNNKKDFWHLIRHFTKKKNTTTTIPPLSTVLPSGETKYNVSDTEKANCLNDYFTSISSIDDSNVRLPPFTALTEQSLERIEITVQEVKDIIDSLCVNKASGPDLISHRMLKGVSSAISVPLSMMFNRFLLECEFPDDYKSSLVIPLFKKGESNLPTNYRPVSLLSSVGKIMERVVFKHIYNFLNENNLIYKYQSGFLPGHSTTYQLVDIFHLICQSFDEKQYSCMVFCDISKAFDRVWHRGLLFKLRQNGIKDPLLTWISNYLSDRSQKVRVNSSISDVRHVSAGVPQGSVLGPLFFLVYVNDITNNLLSLTRLFADDSSLFVSASSVQDIEGILNHDLSVILLWAKQWLVTFNPLKTEAIMFSLKRNYAMPNLRFDNTDIEFVDSHKHLGVTLSCNGQWHTHIENILKSGYKVLGMMRRLKFSFSRQALNQMFFSYLRPLLEYSSIVWDGCTNQDRDSLEKLQNEAARVVTGLTRSVSLINLYNECGWASLAERRKYQKLCFMYKVVNGQAPDYLSQLMPPLVSEISSYQLRNSSDLSIYYTRTETFRRSCMPSSVSLWNELTPEVKQCESFSNFQYKLKMHLFGSRKIPEYFLKGNRYLSVLQARIRNNCSNLNYDLFRNHLTDDPSCQCGFEIEDAKHFFFDCPNYAVIRIDMFRKTRNQHPLNTYSLLYGKQGSSDNDNFFLFQAVHQFIKDSGRFR